MQFQSNIEILEIEISNQQQKKIDEGFQIIKDLKKIDNLESVSRVNNRRHSDFDLNYKLLRLLAMLLLDSLDCYKDSFDIFSIFSSKVNVFENLNEINLKKHIKNKIFIEFSKTIELITSDKNEMPKKSPKKMKEFNKFLIKFLLVQREKFLLTNLENKQMKRIESIYNKISMNDIAISYNKTFLLQKDKKIINDFQKNDKKKDRKHSLKPNKNFKDFLLDILDYEKKIQKRLEKINEYLKNFLHDSMLLALKLIYLSPFSYEYQKNILKDIYEKYFEEESLNVSQFWFENNEESFSNYYKFILELCDVNVDSYKFYNSLPHFILYELNFIVEFLKIKDLALWDPLHIFSSLTLSKSYIIYNEPVIDLNTDDFQNEKSNCIIFHHKDPFLLNDVNIIELIFQNSLIFSI